MDKNLKIALILSATDKASAVLNKAFHNAEKQAKSISKTGREISDIGDKAVIAGGVITAFFGETIHLAEEAQKEANKLNAAFANVGKRGAEIAEQGKKFAEDYQLKIGVKDDEIEAAETKLAVFHNLFTENAIKAKLFERATKAAFDMQALGFGDAATNAQKLGKLLNDPINNLNSMGRTLGKISPAQKAHIALLYSENKLTEAQAYVLGLVEKKFRNAAETTATESDKMGVALHEAGVKIGKSLLPIYNSLIQKFIAILPAILTFIDRHQKMIKYLAAGGVAILGLGLALKFIGFALSGIGAAYKFVIGLGKIFVFSLRLGSQAAVLALRAYEGLKIGLMAINTVVMGSVIPAIESCSAAIVGFSATLLASPAAPFIIGAAAIAAIAYLVIKNWTKVSAFFKSMWNGIKALFTSMGGFFSSIWNGIKKVFTGAWDWISNLTKKFFQAGKNIVISIAKGIWAVITAPIQAIMYLVKKIRNFLPFSPAKEGPLRDIHKVKLVETIAATINAKPLLKAWGLAAGQLRMAMVQQTAFTGQSGGGYGSPIHFNPVINLHGSGTTADGRRITEHIRQDFARMMKEYQHQQGRINH